MPHATTADGSRIAYQVRGDGPPLVLLAGQSNNHTWWDPVRPDFWLYVTGRGTWLRTQPGDPSGAR